MSIWEILSGGNKKGSSPNQERERAFRIATLQDELTTRLSWLERAEGQSNQVEIKLQREEIEKIKDELRELGVEVEEEEKIAA